MDATSEWYWEGNVVDAVAQHLLLTGWRIVSKADTHSRERGEDIRATNATTTLIVEVKGYPSKIYRDPRKAGEPKRTNPSLQAQHWYSHALLKVMRLQTEYSDAVVAMAFPDFPRYRALYEETRSGLQKLDVVVFFVQENGRVTTQGM